MKLLISLVSLLAIAGCTTTERSAAPNELTAAEKKAGWQLLFDGHSLSGWRNYGKPDGPKQGWIVEDGSLKCVAGAHGGDIITTQQFVDFDLQWDWRIAPRANSGIKYLATENRPGAPGHEYQMIDRTIAEPAKRATASFYDVLPAATDGAIKPAGEWNRSRILVRGNTVQHWLNGKKVLEYELGSSTLRAAIASSKFNASTGFGEKIRGHILLTEHQDEASFRNIKILPL